MSKRKAAGSDGGPSKRPKLDALYPGKGQVFGESGTYWNAMLNQTNVGANNNKFYVVQVVEDGGKYSCWTRWGRVGEPGQSTKLGGPSLDSAKKAFKSKFRAKTKNDWDKRANFKEAKGKYTMIDVGGGGGGGGGSKATPAKANTSSGKKSSLPKPLSETIKLIFNHDMFKDSMKDKGIDVDQMPLGELSKKQVAKGASIMQEVSKAIEAKKKGKLAELSSKYYTAIPHSFGRKKPPVIDSEQTCQKEFDLLDMLSDIATGVATTSSDGKLHPDDANYRALGATLKHVPPGSADHKMVQRYIAATKGRKVTLLDLFEVDRKGEGARFKAFSKIKNRKLLWHGTQVAVVVAIMKGGLRIMPHSGGRVGRGIYLASEHGKSSGYVGTTGKSAGRWGGTPGIGFMFLVEAALGKEHEIDKDNRRLTKAPPGSDCVVARGSQEPDSKLDKKVKFEGNEVVVPQGAPKKTKWTKSHFSQSEYLIYKENQVRIRYMLKLKF